MYLFKWCTFIICIDVDFDILALRVYKWIFKKKKKKKIEFLSDSKKKGAVEERVPG
jgi:hypothetical protein